MLFSIITVCYNDLIGLKTTYKSIRDQTWRDFEWIVVDGGSADGTEEWLKGREEEYITWISERDKGIFDAMNKGLQISQGDYLIFMNSADSFADTGILHHVSRVTGDDKYFIYGDAEDVRSELEVFYKEARNHRLLYKGMFTSHQSIFFKKSKLNGQVYKSEFPITSDYAFIAEYLKKCREENIHYLKMPICRFLLGGTNEQKRFRALNEDYRIRREIMKLGVIKSSALYFLHLVHTLLKRIIPGLARKLRYRNEGRS